MHLLLANSSWDLGWDALVAIATGALAAVTFALAVTTSRVSRATRDEAQALSRPILLPVTMGREEVCVRFNGPKITLAVQNVGKGPAFAIRARLDPPELKPDTWSHGILHEGERVELSFREIEEVRAPRYELLLDYQDLAERDVSSRITVQLVATPTAGYELEQAWAFVDVGTDYGHIDI